MSKVIHNHLHFHRDKLEISVHSIATLLLQLGLLVVQTLHVSGHAQAQAAVTVYHLDIMDLDVLQCVCRETFLQHAALNHHTCTCSQTKMQVISAVSKAKEAYIEWQEQKKQRREESATIVMNTDDPGNSEPVSERS
jgi:hypothetical protein